MSTQFKPKSFWSRPEGITGLLFLAAIVGGVGFLLFTFMGTLITLAANTLYLGIMLIALAGLVYMVLDPKVRNLVWYGYKSVMRSITGVFIQMDPIGILKSYIDDMTSNLKKMSKQIANLRAQMRQMKTIIENNSSQIKQNMQIASKARAENKGQVFKLKTRSAGRLKESNLKLEDLHKKMNILYRVLTKMYQNAEILIEDTKDQVQLKEHERKAIRASHSAMKSAMSVISGDSDKRAMFDMAMEAMADDVANKVGEMERFMDVSANFMDSIDLKNGVLEEEGLQMLEKWEKETDSLMLGDDKSNLLNEGSDVLDLDEEMPQRANKGGNTSSDYSNLFD